MITYYQRTRHLFGPIKLEILDPSGKVVDTLPASASGAGINRVTWSMRVEAAARAARGAARRAPASTGRACCPGPTRCG